VRAAIDRARAVIATLGTFAALVRDVAAGPGQWLLNLGAAIMDGIRNHLWRALKAAMQQWFNDKVEQVLGLGRSVWNLLRRGGLGLAQIGRMAWQAIKAAIPPALIRLLIERLVSLLVPAAAAVMAIIQGLQAAWGAVQRVIAAIDRFVAFLRAVKSGNAGPAFAQALAAGAVAVIEFVSQFLLRRLAGAASRVGARIRGIAQRIGQRVMGAVRRGAAAVRRGARRVVASVRRGARRLRDRISGPRTREQKRAAAARRRAAQLERLRKAEQAIRRALARGITGRRLRLWTAAVKLAYRLRSLTVSFQGDRAAIRARINPEILLWAEKLPIVDKEPSPGEDKQALTSYFRAMSLAELRKIARGQQLDIRVKQTREGPVARGGEYCVTTNPEYSRQLAADKRAQADPEKLEYAVLVEIETEGPAVAELAEDPRYGRVQSQQLPGGNPPPPDPLGRPFQRSGERGVVVVKREGVVGAKAENINYMILSKVPSDPDDPIYKVNARIKRISVIGGVAGVTAATLGVGGGE
jgi:hypothetical protein